MASRVAPFLRYRTLEELESLSNSHLSSLSYGGVGNPPLSNVLTQSQRLTHARDLSTIADDVPTAVGLSRRARYYNFRPVDLDEIEDNRMWSPQLYKRPRAATVRTTPARVQAASYRKPRFQTSVKDAWRSRVLIAHGVRFRAPNSTIICIRRIRRRAAIFASGKGGGKHKRARFNYQSQIWC